MKLWVWLNVIVMLSAFPLMFIFPSAAAAVILAGGLSTAIRITRR